MKAFYRNFLVLGIFSLLSFGLQAQFLVSGTVLDAESGEALIGATVVAQGTTTGTTTDINGKFSFDMPLTTSSQIIVSYIGYDPKTIAVDAKSRSITVKLGVGAVMIEEVKIVGTRIKKELQDSPVTVERLGAVAIKETPAPGFYEGLANLKGVDMTSASLGFKVINTRGFNSTSPVRTLQIIDGVDNQAPGLNFSLGNFVGASELDVKSVDLIVGANTATYGPNAFNGVISINTKDPYNYEGFTFSLKRASRDLFDGKVRYARVIRSRDEETAKNIGFAKFINRNVADRLAYKINFTYFTAEDWIADNFAPIEGTPNQPNELEGYDAVNVYGEVSQNMTGILRGPNGQVDTNVLVYRTGYKETDLSDNTTTGFKAQGGLFYKITPKTTASVRFNHGNGTTVYQGDNRYSIRDITFDQVKAEIRGENYFLRAYQTKEDAGNSYDLVFTSTQLLNKAKSNSDWFFDYRRGYRDARRDSAFDIETSLAYARQFADGPGTKPEKNDARYEPGSQVFQDSLNKIISEPSFRSGGTKFQDASSLRHYEGQYKFDLSKKHYALPEVFRIGASYRIYDPNSFGTIFSDTLNIAGDESSGFKEINTNEYGIYSTIEKRTFNDKVNFIGSIRMDDHQNYAPNFSPAISAVIDLTPEDKIRLTYTTAIRNPTLQDQFLYYDIGFIKLVGNIDGKDLVLLRDFTGPDGYLDSAKVNVTHIPGVKPERAQTAEVGFKGIIFKKLYIDVSAYYTKYRDFLGTLIAFRDPRDNRPFQAYRVASNAQNAVTTQGTSIGLNYYLGKHFMASGNYTYSVLNTSKDKNQTAIDLALIPAFNTPKHKFNLAFGGRNINGFGFNINYKFVEGFEYTGSPQFTGFIPSYDLLDAQVNYTFPNTEARFKLGVSNLLNNVHYEAYGAPYIGRLAYITFTFGL